MLIAIPLGNLAVGLPILSGGAAILVFALFLAVFMPETRFAPAKPEDRNNWQHMGDIFTFALAPVLAVAAAILLVSITRNVLGPLYNAWVNQRLDSDTRATVISMSGQVDAIGQIASGPLAGLVSLWSVQAAIAFASFLLTPALPLIKKANRLHENEKILPE